MLKPSVVRCVAFSVLLCCPRAASTAWGEDFVLGGQSTVAKRTEGLPRKITVKRCLVRIKDQVRLPARESGMLTEVLYREGDEVTVGKLLARIDTEAAVMERKVADAKRAAAFAESESDVAVNYAKASADVADAELSGAKEVRKIDPDGISDTELRRLALKLKTAQLQVEQADLDKTVAGLTSSSQAATVEAHDLAIARRSIESPLDGIVVERYRYKGEWVAPGDPICRIVALKTLRVQGYVNARAVPQQSIKGRTATVKFQLADGTTHKATGVIQFVSPIVEANNSYRVWCEIENVKRGQFWVVLPGMEGDMEIDLK